MPDRPPESDLTVEDVGEFGLIDRLARLVSGPEADPLRPSAIGQIGIGDDAALWHPSPGASEVLTTDALIEDVHFRPSTTSWRDLGWKALAENVSDIAAMGALPMRAFVTLGLRPSTRVSDVEGFYRGMSDLGVALSNTPWHGPVIAGGDIVSSPVTMISITVVGELRGEGLRRSAGRPGDLLAVTGVLGGSAGGLAMLEEGGVAPGDPDSSELIRMHRRPYPRVAEGIELAEAGIRCGMDLSDGLLGDVGKLAYASGLAARIEFDHLPLPPALDRRFGSDAARRMALAGGEDYELLIAGPPERIEEASRRLAERGLMRLTVVGQLGEGEPGEVTVVDEHGRPIELPGGSWDHFRTRSKGP